MSTSQKKKKKKVLTSKNWEIVQYVISSRINEPTGFNEQSVEAFVSRTQVKGYVYILHNKDRYTDYDLIKFMEKHPMEAPPFRVEDLVPAHYHIAVELKHPVTVSKIAKWAGVPESAVKKGDDDEYFLIDMANCFIMPEDYHKI